MRLWMWSLSGLRWNGREKPTTDLNRNTDIDEVHSTKTMKWQLLNEEEKIPHV